MKKRYPVSKRHVVKDYKKFKPKENRYYFESNIQTIKSIQHWGDIRRFFNSEFNSILENKITLTHKNSINYENTDILFEYLFIRTITFLEICLKVYCNRNG